MKIDSTCLIERSSVREILISANILSNEDTAEILREVDQLPISTLAEKDAEIERLRAALRIGCGAAINSLPPGEREWSPESGIGTMLKAMGCEATVYGDDVRAALANEQDALKK